MKASDAISLSLRSPGILLSVFFSFARPLGKKRLEDEHAACNRACFGAGSFLGEGGGAWPTILGAARPGV